MIDTRPSLLSAVTELRSFLVGAWRLQREMRDRRLGQTGTLHGAAEFVADGGGLLYRERGALTINCHTGMATRAYRYRFSESHCAEVCFEDGRPFHKIDLSRGIWEAEHCCGDDFYCGSFRVLAPDAWEAIWRIEGPRKDQTLISVYRRSV